MTDKGGEDMSILTSLVVIFVIISLGFVIIKKMLRKLQDKSIRIGLISGFATIIIYIAFSYSVNVLTKGECFITYWQTHEIINGISFDVLKAIGICLSSFVPIILCRYKNAKEVFKYLISACLAYVSLYMLIWVSIYIVALISFVTKVDLKFPLNTWDSMFFALLYFPIGSFVGTLISIVINLILNICPKKRVY